MGRKAQQSHSNRSSVHCVSSGGRVTQHVCAPFSVHLLHSKIFTLQINRTVLLSISATCLSHLYTCICTYKKPMLCIPLCLLFYEEGKKAVFQIGKKNTVHGEIGEQSGAPNKTLVCLLQVCSVTGKTEHAAFFEQSNHIYYYIRPTHHKLFSCNGKMFNLIP